jgi:hypothetical protein
MPEHAAGDKRGGLSTAIRPVRGDFRPFRV